MNDDCEVGDSCSNDPPIADTQQVETKPLNIVDTENVDSLYFKILCPLSVTGLIIGKGGTIINLLNNTCGARIRLSQNHEYFPGTQDRILLLKGDRPGIANGIRELVTRISEGNDKKSNNGSKEDSPNAQRAQSTYQIKVLIPKNASAAIIGKGGSTIKRMSEFSGARYQLGDESDPFNTKERVVTITSLSIANLVKGTQALSTQLFDETKSRMYSNLTTCYSATSSNSSSSSGNSRNNRSVPVVSSVVNAAYQQVLPNAAVNNAQVSQSYPVQAEYSIPSMPAHMIPQIQYPVTLPTHLHLMPQPPLTTPFSMMAGAPYPMMSPQSQVFTPYDALTIHHYQQQQQQQQQQQHDMYNHAIATGQQPMNLIPSPAPVRNNQQPITPQMFSQAQMAQVQHFSTQRSPQQVITPNFYPGSIVNREK